SEFNRLPWPSFYICCERSCKPQENRGVERSDRQCSTRLEPLRKRSRFHVELASDHRVRGSRVYEESHPIMTTASAQERIEHDLPLQGSALGRGAPDIHCGISVGHDQIVLDGTSLESRTVAALARQASARIRLSERCRAMVQTSRAWLDDRVQDGEAIYGATTGVGGFAGWLLSPEQAAGLQRNLIAAVASNMGPYLPNDAVRAAMLARINVLARGHSAIRLETLDHLVEMFNRGVIPRIPSLGSLGASGDLGPLACIALV